MSKYYIDAEFEIKHYASMTLDPTPDVTEQDRRNSLIILTALRMAKRVTTKEVKYFDEDEKVWKIGEVIVSDSEKPNNSERSSE